MGVEWQERQDFRRKQNDPAEWFCLPVVCHSPPNTPTPGLFKVLTNAFQSASSTITNTSSQHDTLYSFIKSNPLYLCFCTAVYTELLLKARDCIAVEVRHDGAPHAVLFVIFAILWRDKHVHTFFPLHFTCWDSTWEVQMDVNISVRSTLWILRQKQQHTHRAQHSTAQVFLWRRSGTPRGPVLQRWVQAVCVSLHTMSVCVCVSRWLFCRGGAAAIKTHTQSLSCY